MNDRDVFTPEQRDALHAWFNAQATSLRLTLDRHDRDLARLEHAVFGDPQYGIVGFAARLERIETAVNTLQDQYDALLVQARAIRDTVRIAAVAISILLTLFDAPDLIQRIISFLGGV